MTESPIISRADVSPTCRGTTGLRHNGWNPTPLVAPDRSRQSELWTRSFADLDPNGLMENPALGRSHGWCPASLIHPISRRTCGSPPCRSSSPLHQRSFASAPAGISSPTTRLPRTVASCAQLLRPLPAPTASPKRVVRARTQASPSFAAGHATSQRLTPRCPSRIGSTCPTSPFAPALSCPSTDRSDASPACSRPCSRSALRSPPLRRHALWWSPALSPLPRSYPAATRPSSLSPEGPASPALFP